MKATVTQLPTPRQRAARKAAATRRARQHYRIRYGLVCPPWCNSGHHDGARTHSRHLGAVGIGRAKGIWCHLEQEPYHDPVLQLFVLSGKGTATVTLSRDEVEELRRELSVSLGYLPRSGDAI